MNNMMLQKKLVSYFMIRVQNPDIKLGDRYIIIDDMPEDMAIKMSFIDMIRAERKKAKKVWGWISFCSINHPRRKNVRHKVKNAKHLTLHEIFSYNLEDLWN